MSSQESSSLWQNTLPPGSTICALDEHSFSDEAARRVAALVPGVSVRNVTSFSQVWQGVKDGDTGISPFENANDGVVWPNLDELRRGAYRIMGEIHQSVNMCAGVREGVALDQTTQVCSFPKAIGQSSRWIDHHPNLTRNEQFNSTVDAIRFVADHKELLAVALGSRAALQHHGLVPIAEDVANSPSAQNITRMFLVKKNGGMDLPDSSRRHHAALVQLEDYDGSLHDALGIIRQAAGLSSIHSRNVAHMQYEFFMQMTKRLPQEARSSDRFERMAAALEQLVGKEHVRWLGSWDCLLQAED